MELVQRIDALENEKYLMLPQNFYGDFFYMVRGEIRDSTHQKVDKEVHHILLKDEDSVCWPTTMTGFLTEDNEHAFNEYHNDEGEPFEPFELPLIEHCDLNDLPIEAKAELLHECNRDLYRLSIKGLSSLCANSLYRGQSVKSTAGFYDLTETTVQSIKDLVFKGKTDDK